ncbi:hypothetical protein ABEO62_08625 [Geobacillus stearothermophilus]
MDEEKDLAQRKREAAARAKAAAAGEDGGAAKPSASSPNDPLLQKYVRIIEEHLGPDVLEDAYINRLAKDVPTLVVPRAAIHANHPIHRPDGLLVGDDEQLCALPCGRNDDGH